MNPQNAILLIAAAPAVALADTRTAELSPTSLTWDRLSDTGAFGIGICGGVFAPDSVNNGVAYKRFFVEVTQAGATLDVRVNSLEPAPLDFDPMLAVYCDEFDPGDRSARLIALDDDGAGYPDARASQAAALSLGETFVVVVSSYSNWAPSQHGAFEVVLGDGLAFTDPCPADIALPFGVLNFFDVTRFITLYNAQAPEADLAAPFGVFNFFDISAFITQYNAGCP